MKRTGLLVLIATALLFSCGQQRAEYAAAADSTGVVYAEPASEAKSQAPMANAAATPTKDLYAGLNRNIIKKADFRFEVKDVHKTTDAIETLLLK